MKAAVCHEFGKPLVVEDIEIDSPRRGEVLVRMAAAAICHSDVHIVRGEWGGELPLVAGHECAGVVEAVGEGVAGVKAGDRAVVSLLRSCGRCHYCVTGLPYPCEGAFALQKESRLHDKTGQRIAQAIRVAGFAEKAVVEASQLVPVPQDMPLDRAALLACGVITGLGAVVNTARVRPGQSMVVIGVGGVGVNSIQGGSLSGAHPIVAVDVVARKLDVARKFGATHTVNAREAQPVETVKDLTQGRGADYVFVTIGSPAAVEQAFQMTGPRGTVVIVGMPRRDATAALPIFSTVTGERRIVGSPMGSTRLSQDVPWLLELYRCGRLKLDELITQRYPLGQINEAIASTESGESLRNVIMF